jgi:ElaB/YqjD/DUF883 family membrane-anchored ribosome-binding protein
MIMAEKMIDSTIVKTDQMKVQTAEALEQAARKLRNVNVSEQTDDVRRILADVESRMNRFRDEAGIEFKKMETEYHKKVEPVEHIIIDHPIPSVLIAAGIGALIGMLLFKARD